MALNYREKIGFDKKDGRLLYLLDLDARAPLTVLAKKLGLSEEGVSYRLKRLQERGAIKSFSTVIDASAMGYIGGGWMIRLQHCDQKMENEILDYFKARKNVWWLNSRGGEYDMGVGIFAKDAHEYHLFIREFLQKYRRYVAKVSPRIYHEALQFSRAYLADEKIRGKEKPIVLWNGAPRKTDETDNAILHLIASHARLPTVEIAKQLGLTPMIVKYRIKRMEKDGIIKGYRAVLDLSKLGHFWYKADFQLSDYSRRAELLQYASSHPNIIYAYDGIGVADFEVEMEVTGTPQLMEIIDAMKARFSDVIVRSDYYLWSKEHRIAYLP